MELYNHSWLEVLPQTEVMPLDPLVEVPRIILSFSISPMKSNVFWRETVFLKVALLELFNKESD
ncbi:hypothetical protein [Bacillus smithii]|uniref:hypothetical protein n=1 Tax=Bacillus smithii TaxID=1479 RepID=UPI003D205E5C